MALISKRDFAKALQLNRLHMSVLAGPLMKMLGLQELNEMHRDLRKLRGEEFLNKLIENLGVTINVDKDELKHVPKEGPFIIVANHPYGGLDGIILLKLLTDVRPDFRVMANFILKKIPNVSQYIIAVNPFENNPDLNKYNLSGMRETLQHLGEQRPLGIFPAGEVSALQTNRFGISDKAWHPAVAKIISKAKVPVIPIYFHGSNSNLFNFLGLLNPSFRTAKLPSEFLNKKGVTVKVRVGRPIPYAEMENLSDAEKLHFLRTKTYALGNPLRGAKKIIPPIDLSPEPESIPRAIDDNILDKELSELPPEAKLFSMQNFEMYVAKSEQIPLIMREIGRIRELTFRQVGEGTNRAIDLDEFDNYYMHLFLWDSGAKKIVGAYRFGKGDEIYRKHGIKGFYTSTLFKMDEELSPTLEQALELGRSFIAKEYQQKALPLMLLWRGILTYLYMNKQYRYLFGPVSISNNFSKISKAIMISYIKRFHFDDEMAKYVEPRKEFHEKDEEEASDVLLHGEENDLKSVDDLVAEIEPNHIGIPVLLKKYIKQNAKIIAFNIDPKFSNALDGLMVLDLSKVPEDTIKMLEKESKKMEAIPEKQ